MNALALEGEEGRDYLRKAMGSWMWATIRRYPNGATQHVLHVILMRAHKWGETQGSETSQYLKEKKDNISIP